MIVPWITLWSDEVVPPRQTLLKPGPDRVRYADEDPSDRWMGVLWTRERIGKSGTPLFSQVHSRRQRRAITQCRCQVCGCPLPTSSIPWILPMLEWDLVIATGEFLTSTAPTCEPCQPQALRLCPHLRDRGHVRLTASRAVAWGILGDLYHPLSKIARVTVPFDDWRAPHMIAKQLVVRIDDYDPLG